MPYNDDLAQRIRKILARRKGLAEKKMFGGVAFLLRGHMCCGILRDHLILRVGPEEDEKTLRKPHVKKFDITGRPMRGFVMVEPKGYGTDESLKRWLGLAAGFVKTLPEKAGR